MKKIFSIFLLLFLTLAGYPQAVTTLSGGAGGQVHYQSGVSVTAFLANGSAGQVLMSNGTTLAPSWLTLSGASVGTATNLAGGAGGSIPYQSAAGTTAMLANGTAGQVLTSAGTTLAPTWTTPSSGLGGSGTVNRHAKFTAGTTLGNSIISDNGTTVDIANTGASQTVQLLNAFTGGTFLAGGFDASGYESANAISVMGDYNAVASSTQVIVNSTTETISLTSGNGATLNTTGTKTWNFFRTRTAPGTTGAQTINRPTGSVNFAAGASSLVVTNSIAVSTSFVLAMAQTNDATCFVASVVPASGSFTIRMTSNCTAETLVSFWVLN